MLYYTNHTHVHAHLRAIEPNISINRMAIVRIFDEKYVTLSGRSATFLFSFSHDTNNGVRLYLLQMRRPYVFLASHFTATGFCLYYCRTLLSLCVLRNNNRRTIIISYCVLSYSLLIAVAATAGCYCCCYCLGRPSSTCYCLCDIRRRISIVAVLCFGLYFVVDAYSLAFSFIYYYLSAIWFRVHNAFHTVQSTHTQHHKRPDSFHFVLESFAPCDCVCVCLSIFCFFVFPF